MNILVFGDSHIQVFDYMKKVQDKYKFQTIMVNGATAQGAVNPNNKSHSIEIFTTQMNKLDHEQYDYIMIMLGEVDCGFVIWYRAQKWGITVEEQLDNSVNNLFQFIEERVATVYPYDRIILVGATLPTIKDGQSWGNVANMRKKVSATQKERTELTIKYNSRLKENAANLGCLYMDIIKQTLAPGTGLIREKYINENPLDHHLSNYKSWFDWFNQLHLLQLTKKSPPEPEPVPESPETPDYSPGPLPGTPESSPESSPDSSPELSPVAPVTFEEFEAFEASKASAVTLPVAPVTFEEFEAFEASKASAVTLESPEASPVAFEGLPESAESYGILKFETLTSNSKKQSMKTTSDLKPYDPFGLLNDTPAANKTPAAPTPIMTNKKSFSVKPRKKTRPIKKNRVNTINSETKPSRTPPIYQSRFSVKAPPKTTPNNTPTPRSVHPNIIQPLVTQRDQKKRNNRTSFSVKPQKKK